MTPQCSTCGDELTISSDYDDEFVEYSCGNTAECEHPGCLVVSCGEDTKPRACDLCGLNFCTNHLSKVADEEVCEDCLRAVR